MTEPDDVLTEAKRVYGETAQLRYGARFATAGVSLDTPNDEEATEITVWGDRPLDGLLQALQKPDESMANVTHTVHEAAADFAAEFTRLWEKDCGTHGEAHKHFEVRVWDGRWVVFRALTATANGWHRCQRLHRKQDALWGYPITAVFCVPGEDFVAAMKARAA